MYSVLCLDTQAIMKFYENLDRRVDETLFSSVVWSKREGLSLGLKIRVRKWGYDLNSAPSFLIKTCGG